MAVSSAAPRPGDRAAGAPDGAPDSAPDGAPDGVHDTARGVAWVLVACVIFTLVYASGRLAGGGVGGLQIMAIRYASALVCIVGFALARRGGVSACRSPRPFRHFSRAMMGGLGGACLIQGVTLLPMAEASAIGLLDGVFSVILGIVLLGERVRPLRWLGVALSLVGGVLVIAGRADLSGLLDHLLAGGAVFYPLAGAAFVAMERVLMRQLALREGKMAILFHVNLFGTLILMPVALMTWVPLEGPTLALLIAFGPLALLGQFCNIRGFALAEVSITGPVWYSWLIFAAALGWVMFDEVPGPGVILGGAVIALGGVFLCASGRKRTPALPADTLGPSETPGKAGRE
ncbi:hypothetical protein F11_10315 [Rhodospirillum rubrum F11]|uniref:EamA domain-containing protein n=2 Tax=Rhodospirillum rubrum TaxID=1085 RepID=Q2RST8_RHORT|nr:DMT family transporter [Rhodospirillum rubrum]ABC22807.1 Protein of unknown function DUF6, transmembrane [Rhodospirillum rubrum ATCC 11170]AEO48529.1 hypothetical protein F11_10315 [Rhodospirillum rubrum F11]MBK5954405.1 EamA family transporter [Rhodospirillum rubrum]QXG78797.1 DMT family transporter [Rhodospirillum rubrum]HCF19416.1 EamA/RhaT family transporter [Rhodospirillum rubrum]